ncbi:MAG: AAA family ATPase [Candidatus Thorarchaeota archaeon]|nr:MAG: AAA family ATPase [Candidatus Thorarchaeota archaeon]
MVKGDLILPSGVSSLDRILNGGLSTGHLTHVFGSASAGKTTLALQFVAGACRLGIRVAYINSETTSPLERLSQITEKEFTELEDTVRILSPKTFEEQGAVINDLELYAREETQLIVVDTLTRLYRTVLEDKTANYAAHRELNMQAGILKGLARQKDMAVLVLNQVRGSLEETKGFVPVAHNILDYWADYAIRMTRGTRKGERHLERLLPEDGFSQTVFITERGFSLTEKPQE